MPDGGENMDLDAHYAAEELAAQRREKQGGILNNTVPVDTSVFADQNQDLLSPKVETFLSAAESFLTSQLGENNRPDPAKVNQEVSLQIARIALNFGVSEQIQHLLPVFEQREE